MGQHVLVVEDDDAIRDVATMVLERAGFAVSGVVDGPSAVERIDAGGLDLVVLDLMLPGLHGFDVCRQVRSRSGVPIVMLTARTGSADVVAGLELGADDYVTKPFEPAELVARVRAVLRRYEDPGAPLPVEVHDLVIDPGAHRVAKDGVDLSLTAIEFRLLLTLASQAGQALTREVLLERVWGYDYLGDSRLVDMAVKRLRDKLGDDAAWPRYITTVRSVGYRFERG